VFKWTLNGVERERPDSSGSGEGSVFVMDSVPTFCNLRVTPCLSQSTDKHEVGGEGLLYQTLPSESGSKLHFTNQPGISNSSKQTGPGSSVGIAGRSGDRIPVGERFFAHVQIGPGAHPASCTMGTASFLGVKRPGRGADHPPPSSAEIENE
jgi:hypothetical protein